MDLSETASGSVHHALIIEDASPTLSANEVSKHHDGATLFQVNPLLGIGILSMPYAMSGAGAAGLLSVWLCCALLCGTGKFIHKALEMMPADKPQSYPALGKASLGRFGSNIVTTAAIAGLFGSSCMSLIIMWRSTEVTEGSGISAATIRTGSVLLGIAAEALLCIFGTYKTLTAFSAAGCVSTGAVILLVAALPVLDPRKKWLQEAPEHHVISWDIVPASSIFLLGVAGHSAFPSVRASMADKHKFPAAVNIAYAACAVATGAVCAAGYWYWGDSADVLVTTDIQNRSPYAAYTLRGVGVQHLVEALVAVNVATKVPLFVIALQDYLGTLIADAVGRGETAVHPSSARMLRAVTVTAIVTVALAAQDVLGDVETLIGAVSSCTTSILLPTAFYASLSAQRGTMRLQHWAAAAAVLALGLALMGTGLAQTIYNLAVGLEGGAAGAGGASGAGASSLLEGLPGAVLARGR